MMIRMMTMRMMTTICVESVVDVWEEGGREGRRVVMFTGSMCNQWLMFGKVVGWGVGG